MGYKMNNNYIELITGISSVTNPVYREAANDVETGNDKGLKYLKNFLTNIETINEKAGVADKRISASKGNIKEFAKYDSIKFSIDFLNKNLGSLEQVKECTKVFDALEDWAPMYKEAYEKNVRVVVLEYENALYMLVTSLASIFSTKMDVVANGTEIKIVPKNGATHGVIDDTMKDLSKHFSDRKHKTYLESMIQAADSEFHEAAYNESALTLALASLQFIDGIFKNGVKLFTKGTSVLSTLKSTLFGIIPLIRTIIYLRYKKKADTIAALEENVFYIQRNIEQLQKMTTMDPEKKAVIIKKQQAYVAMYKKKAEKLRAELMEGEKEATEAAKKDEKVLSSDDELVLEAAVFTEATTKIGHPRYVKPSKVSKKEMTKIRNDIAINSFAKSSKSVAKSEKKTVDKEFDTKCQQVADEFMKKAAKKSIGLTFTTVKSEPKDVTTSKIGGSHWLAEGTEIPSEVAANDMGFLAQINFAEMPKLDGYPSSGLLQIFAAGDTWKKKATCATIFIEDPEKCKFVKSDVQPFDDSYEYPILNDRIYTVKGKLEDTVPTYCLKEYYDILTPIYNKVFGTSVKAGDIPYDAEKLIHAKIKVVSTGTRIGGYPYFTQSDVRTKKYNTLLLQIDSEEGIMWGDCGVSNVFIDKEALRKKDFSDVMFTWDCL